MTETGLTTSSLPTETGPRRLLRARGSSVFVLLVLLIPVLVTATVYEAVNWSRCHSYGLLFSMERGIVWFADARWEGAAKGDRVIAVDGQPVADVLDTRALLCGRPTGPVTVRFSRGDAEFERTAETRPRGAAPLIAIWLRVLVGTAMVIAAAVVFFMRPGTPVTWLFLLFTYTLGAFLIGVIATQSTPWLYYRLQATLTAAYVSFGLHFFATFPRPLQFIVGRRWRVILLYLPAVVMLAVYLAIYPREELTWLWRGAYNGLQFWQPVVVILGVVFLVFQYREAKRATDYRALAQYRAVVVGLTSLFLPALWNMARLVFGVLDNDWAIHLNGSTVVIFVITTGFAIVKHNTLAVDRFTAAVVGYGATLVLLAIAFAAVLFGVPVLVGKAALFQSTEATVAITAAAFFSFMPLYRRLKRRVDRWFSRDVTSSGKTALILRELTRRFQVSDREKSYAATLEAVATLRVERVEIWIMNDTGDAVIRIAAQGAPVGEGQLPRIGPLCTALTEGARAGGVDGLCSTLLDSEAQIELWSKELALAVPVTAFGAFAGFVGVGRKRSGAAFKEEEQDFVEAIAAQIALVLERGSTEQTKFGAYRIERRLGVGGMAEVFLAWQLGPGGFERRVALKKLLPHFAEEPEIVSMFLDEARIAAQLTHSRIAQIYEVGKQGRAFFLAMEYVDGPSLRQLLRAVWKREEHVPVPVAVAIAAAVVEALGYAHQATDARGRAIGVVHRDVTPSNVQLTAQGGVKLLDFGIARAATQLHVTRTGVVKGTLPYMSPEQAMGRAVDGRSDLFSVGAILYEILCARRAFPEGPRHERPERVLQLRPDVPGILEALIGKAIAFEAAERFSSAEEMLQALQQVLGDVALPTEREIGAWMSSVIPRLGQPDDAERDPVDEPTVQNNQEGQPATATDATKRMVGGSRDPG